MAKNKILEILERIDVEKVGNETLKKKIIELKDDVKDLDDSDFSKSKEAEETEKAYIKNANTIISLVEKTSPAALSAKAVVTRKPKEERPKAPEKKVEPKPEPKKEPEKKPEAKKPEPKKEEKKPMKVVVKPKAKKEPEKKYKITPKAKKAAEEKPKGKKEIEVKVKPTDELSNVRDILEEANYTVIVKKVGKTTVKRKAPRQDRTIVKDKVEDVFTTIQKDIPKEKDGKQVEKVTEKLKAIFTKILVAIDKLTTSGNLSQLQKLEAFLKKLVQKEKFEGGDAIGGEYIVNVGNIGNIEYDTKEEAEAAYDEYVEQSMSNHGRAAGEDVTLMIDGEPVKEYFGTLGEEEFAKGGGVGGEIKDIAKFKQNLIQKAKQKGLYEDFGQDEVRKLTDKYGYTSNVAAFDNWAMNFDLSQL